MTLNTSSTIIKEPRFTLSPSHADAGKRSHREVSLKQSLGLKSSSLTSRGVSVLEAKCCRVSGVFGGGLGQGRVYRKGKCSAGSLGYQWKGCVCAMPDNGVAFLYLPPLIHPQRKDNVKETCSRNISRTAYNTITPLPAEKILYSTDT